MQVEIDTIAAPSPSGSYSQGMRAGPFVFTAGMGPYDPQSGAVVGTTIKEQTRQTLTNLDAVLTAAGLHRDNVVKVTAHLQNLQDFPGYDAAYREYFNQPFPARTTVGSQLAGILLEVDFIAYVPETTRG
jgi:2-iminobutanoate/2-iminopropanoate deaminase